MSEGAGRWSAPPSAPANTAQPPPRAPLHWGPRAGPIRAGSLCAQRGRWPIAGATQASRPSGATQASRPSGATQASRPSTVGPALPPGPGPAPHCRALFGRRAAPAACPAGPQAGCARTARPAALHWLCRSSAGGSCMWLSICTGLLCLSLSLPTPHLSESVTAHPPWLKPRNRKHIRSRYWTTLL